MAKKQMTIYAPASMANICVGFDILGAAISPINGQLLGDYVTVAPAKQFNLINKGSFVTKLPKNPKLNIVYQCWEYFCQTIGESLPVAITLEKNMPIGSGLGSSACSVVGALMALNEFFDNPFNSMQLLRMMGELEGRISGSVHYDNVAPCYLGGMQLILNEIDIISQTIPHFADWYWVMAYPGIKVSTAEARAILPAQYQKQTCIDHSRHIGGFIHACYSQQPQLAAAFMQDLIAEPYRQQLLPGFTQAKQTLIKLGALACGISGSGPTLFAVADDLTLAKQLAGWLEAHYVQNNAGFVHIAKIDIQGARRIERK